MKKSVFAPAQKGFTMLEILLAVAAIAILAGIVIVAINPGKQLGNTRNSERRAEVNTILNAVYQFSIDNDGNLPAAITEDQAEICQTGGVCEDLSDECVIGGVCNHLVDLSSLTSSEEYVIAIPADPTGASANGVGYEIIKSANGRVAVIAPDAEQGATISVAR